MRIIKEDSIGLIIDIQEKIFPHISDNENIANNTVKLIKGFQSLGIEILVTEQYSKGLGNTISKIGEALGNYEFIEKSSFSCCGSDRFCDALLKTEKKNIIIAGIESHVCVLQTTIDLISMGKQPVLVEDCVSSRFLNDKKIALERMRQEGVIITTYESILFELCRVSGNDTFKKISKIVK